MNHYQVKGLGIKEVSKFLREEIILNDEKIKRNSFVLDYEYSLKKHFEHKGECLKFLLGLVEKMMPNEYASFSEVKRKFQEESALSKEDQEKIKNWGRVNDE